MDHDDDDDHNDSIDGTDADYASMFEVIAPFRETGEGDRAGSGT